MNNKILITGAAGFIGFHISKLMLEENYEICGVDNINNYYSISLKNDRLSVLKQYPNFTFNKVDISYKTHPEMRLIDALTSTTSFPILIPPLCINNHVKFLNLTTLITKNF